MIAELRDAPFHSSKPGSMSMHQRSLKTRLVFVLATALLLFCFCAGCASQVRATERPGRDPDGAVPEQIVLPDPQIGPGDEIEVQVHRQPEMARTLRIPPSGIVFFPLVGEVHTRGMTVRSLRRTITDGLRSYFKDPQVSIELTVVRSQKIVVLGEVARPGIFTIHGPTHTLEAVGMAGGFLHSANRSKILLLRERDGDLASEFIDIHGAFARGELTNNIQLWAGDVVYVPPTFIADWARFARDVEDIIRPALLTETGILLGYDIRDAVEGERAPRSTAIVIPR